MTMLRVLLCLIVLLNVAWADALPKFAAPYVLSSATPSQMVGQQMAYLPGLADASFEHIQQLPHSQWRANSKPSLSLPSMPEGVWGRIDLINQDSQADPWLLEIKWPILDQVKVRAYYPQRQTWGPLMQAGDALPVSTRPRAERFLVYPLDLPTGEPVSLYFQAFAHEAMLLPIQLLSQAALEKAETQQLSLIYLFFGGMLVMLLYNSSLYLFTRDRSYLFYSFYLICITGYQLTITGMGQLYLWPENTQFSAKAYGLLGSLSFFSAMLFARNFLQLPHYKGWVLHSNSLMIGYWAVMALAVIFSPVLVPYLLPNFLPLLTTLIASCGAIYLWYRGNFSARLFTIAWACLIIFTLIHLLAVNGRLPLNTFTLGSQMIGVYLELVLLSIALAERINRERAQRIQAQHSALEASQNLALEREQKLAAQRSALHAQNLANEHLERRVQERTQALEQSQQRLQKAIRELANLSITDSLTQLHNRRHFDNIAKEEVARAQRTGTPLALMMLDIDHFKQINDRYGHPFGDECLRQVAAILANRIQRAGDLAARYGGEEFIVLLPTTELHTAQQLAERIRQSVEDLRLPHNSGDVRLTLSIGVASFTPEHSIDELLHCADKALYAAKHAGRNQVQIGSPNIHST